MKSAARVFIIIGMAVQAILIFPIVLGIFALKALDNAKTHNDLIGWGIVTLLFVNTVGGALMLCIKDEELEQNKPATIDDNPTPTISDNVNSVVEDNLITEELNETL